MRRGGPWCGKSQQSTVDRAWLPQSFSIARYGEQKPKPGADFSKDQLPLGIQKSLDVSEALICGLHGLGFFRKRKETCFGFGLEGTW